MRRSRIAIRALAAYIILLGYVVFRQAGGTQLASKSAAQEAKAQNQGKGHTNFPSKGHKAQSNSPNLAASRDEDPWQTQQSNGTTKMEVRMQLGQRPTDVVVPQVWSPLHTCDVPPCEQVEVQIHQEECKAGMDRTKETQGCSKNRPSQTLLRTGRRRRFLEYHIEGTLDRNNTTNEGPCTKGGVEGRSRTTGEGERGPGQEPRGQEASGYPEGGIRKQTVRRSQDSSGQSSTTNRATDQTRPCDKSREDQTCIPTGTRYGGSAGPGMGRAESPLDRTLQITTQCLSEAAQSSLRKDEGEKKSLARGQSNNSTGGLQHSRRGGRGSTGRVWYNGSSGGSTEEVGHAVQGANQDRRRRGIHGDSGRLRGGSCKRQGHSISSNEGQKKGKREREQMKTKTKEWINWNSTAPRDFFKAATDTFDRPNVGRDYSQSSFLNQMKQGNQRILALTITMFLTIALWAVRCNSNLRCCRRMARGGRNRISQRRHVRLYSRRILKRILCNYLLVWHLTGCGVEAMGHRPSRISQQDWRTAETQEPDTDTKDIQTQQEEQQLQQEIHANFGGGQAAIVMWVHQYGYRFHRRGIREAMVIEKTKPHLGQILRRRNDIAQMQDRRWVKSEREIRWGSIKRTHWMAYNGEVTPIWAYIHENERSVLWSMLIEEGNQRWQVGDLFQRIMPEHRCYQNALCRINEKRWDQEIWITPGTVFDMIHRMPQEDEGSNSTTANEECWTTTGNTVSDVKEWGNVEPDPTPQEDKRTGQSEGQEEEDDIAAMITGAQQRERPKKREKDFDEPQHPNTRETGGQTADKGEAKKESSLGCSSMDGYRRQEDLRNVNQLIQDAEREWQEIREFTEFHTEVINRQEMELEIRALGRMDEQRFTLIMHGLREQSIGTREKQIDMTRFQIMTDLIIAIRQAWQDQIQAHGMATVSHVRPQPRITEEHNTRSVHVIVDLDPTIFGAPMLLSISQRYALFDAGAHSLRAIRETNRVSKWSLMDRSNTIETCQDANNLCNFWAGGELLDLQEIAPQHGMLVAVDVAYGLWQWNIEEEMDQAEETTRSRNNVAHGEAEDTDMTAWTQVTLRSVSRSRTPPTSRGLGISRFREALVFEENHGYPREIPMDQVPRDVVKEYVEDQMRNQDEETRRTRAELFEVRPNPPNIVNKNAIAFIWRPLVEQQPGMVIILLDISVIPYNTIPDAEATNYRNTIHVQQSSTRAEMLHEIGVAAIGQEDDCIVITRGLPWEENDASVRQHENGDYFMISTAHKPQRKTPREVLRDLIEWQQNRGNECDRRTTRRRIERRDDEPDSSELMQQRLIKETSKAEGKETGGDDENRKEEEEEVFSAMATNRTPRKHTSARIYTMAEEEHQVIVPLPNIPENQFRAHVFRETTRDYMEEERGAYCLHTVVPNPEDRESKKELSYILEDDTMRPMGKVPILLDVNVISNHPRGVGPTDEWRETTYVPQRTTRRQFITIKLGPWCHRGSCILQMGGRLWRTNDADTWALFPGIFATITVLNEQCDVPFHIQWRQRNGPSQHGDRSHTSSSSGPEAPQDEQMAEQGESSPSQIMGSDPESDMTGMIQKTTRGRKKYKQTEKSSLTKGGTRGNNGQMTFARAAKEKLPPPGNGVKFQEVVEIHEDGGTHLARDKSIGNRFIEGFCETRDGMRDGRGKEIINNIRFEPVEEAKTSGPGTPQHVLPITSSQDSLNMEQDDEYQKVERKADQETPTDNKQGSTLPIRLNEMIGDLYRWKTSRNEQVDEGLDFGDTIDAHQWFMAHQTMPNYGTEGPQWKRSSRQWLDTRPSPPPEEGEWHLFVDGSNQDGMTGSGGIIFFNDGFEWTTGGWIGIKSEGVTSFQAEVQAMAIAAKWVLDNLKHWPLGIYPKLRVFFHFDNQAAGWGALGSYGNAKSLPEVSLARSILQMIRTGYGIEVEGMHHKSHEGDVGNEMADDIAKHCAMTKQADDEFWKTAFEKETAERAEWFWMLYRRDLTNNWSGRALKIPKPEAVYTDKVVTDALPRQSKKGRELEVEWDLRFASYNPMSLKGQGKKGARDFSMLEATLRQFDEIGIQIVALQETRLQKRTGTFNPHYHLVMGKADKKGNGGVCIALSKKIPIGYRQGKELFIRDEDWKLIHEEENILVILLQTTLGETLIVNAHCPHSGNDEQLLCKWWDDLETVLLSQRGHKKMVFMGDINGRIGQIQSSAVGNNQEDEETVNGKRFHEMLSQWAMWCPSTFTENHRGKTTTWTSPQGHESRIDFIGIPEEWKLFQVGSRGLPQIIARDFMHDHTAIQVEVKAKCKTNEEKYSKRYVPKRKIIDKEESEEWRRCLNKIPKISWDTDVHSHAMQLHSQIKRKIDSCFDDRRQFVYKSFIQDDTWTLIQEKQKLRKDFFACGGDMRRNRLRECFNAWAGTGTGIRTHEDRKQKQITMAQNQSRFDRISKQVKQMMRRDEEAFFEQLTQGIQQADEASSQKIFWAKIKRMLPKYASRRQQIRASKIAQLKGKWAPYLCALEAGEVTQMENLYKECIERQNSHHRTSQTCRLVPTLKDVEDILRAIRPDRVGGPDGVDPSWICKGAINLAPSVFDLWMKILVWGTEPIQFKGGALTMLPKGQATGDPSSFRGVMLGPCLSKGLHAHLRKPLMQELERVRPPGQIGGFRSKECSFGAQYIRCITDISQRLKISSAVIYIDLRTAFHSLIRQLVVGDIADSPQEWNLVKETLDREGNTRGVKTWLTEGGNLQRIGASQEIIKVMTELSTNAWAFLDSEVIRTSRGSRPGSPIADATFHCTMCDVGWQMERLADEVMDEVPKLKELEVTGHPIIWADDLAVPIFSQEASGLREKIERTLDKISQAFTSRGFVLNLGKGKTEVVPTWVGTGAPEERRRILEEMDPHFKITKPSGAEQKVRIQARYKHLGAIQESGGGMESETKARVAAAWTAFRQLNRNLLCNRKYKLTTRMNLLESLVFSKMFYATGSWPRLTSRQAKRMKKAYVAMARQVTGMHFKKGADNVSDEYVLGKNRLLDTTSRLRIERLRYAARFYRHGEPFMHKAADAQAALTKDAWKSQIREDWDWFRSIQGNRWGETLEEAIDNWKKGKSGWKNQVGYAAKRHILQEELARRIRGQTKEGTESTDHEMKQQEEGIQCSCGKVFQSKRAWAMHATVAHQRRTEANLYQGTRCLICLQEMWTNPRLKQHISYIGKNDQSNRCHVLATHLGCHDEECRQKDEVPLPGLRRRERIRLAGPMVCGADKRDREFIKEEKQKLRVGLEEKLALGSIADALQLAYFEDLEITYSESGVADLKELLDFVGLEESHKAVTYLFWGQSRDWENEQQKSEWISDLRSYKEGEELWAWHQLEALDALLSTQGDDEPEDPKTANLHSRGKKEKISERPRRILEITMDRVQMARISCSEWLQVIRPGAALSFLRRLVDRVA